MPYTPKRHEPTIILLAFCLFCILSCSTPVVSPWTADDTNICKNGCSNYFIGTNLWYAGRLASDEKGRQRLDNELDRLKELGVTNLRVLAVEGEVLGECQRRIFQPIQSECTMIRRSMILLCSILCVFCSGPNDNPGTLETLEIAVSERSPLFGHQDDLMYGHTWNVTKENDHGLTRSDVLSTAGAYPYILGLDLGGLEIDSPVNLDGNDFNLMREAAEKHYGRGGIVTLSWHLRNPLTGGDAWDVSSDEVVTSILPGGANHDRFISWLDKVSDFVASLKDADGEQIPVIWRPWHEHTGGWFWWGEGHCTHEQFKSLWRMTYDYMERERNLDGLLWAISPNSLDDDFGNWEDTYPGDDVVDIVGLDCYCPTYLPQDQAIPKYIADMRRCLGSLTGFAEKHGKTLAVTETGYEGLTYEKWWTEVLAPAIDGFPVSYLLVWRNTDEMPRGMTHFYAPWPGGPSENDFIDFIDSGKVRLL